MQQQLITTVTLAKAVDVKPASIRTALWRHGHYCGLRPIRLENGRLRWPADAVERLTAGASQ
ncbi:hypothetical protein SAMN05421829_102335 [Aromatoleum tolulyticum]|uniref:Helix-turn-helix domain-containing protein n=1 Tax=Aromatoleum tolulyticum TaxID=34027 RepID=A0A1N6Q4D2_9RHOO|nr:DNA-binding protein [Aromatoleum tolulyticum]SIQ11329.1 hypothetical protein SAMN05421829_102335 [Aromatoleum tolulyticum]